MNVHVNPVEGQVLVTFPTAVSWFKLSPEQARGLAQALTQVADAAEKPPEAPK